MLAGMTPVLKGGRYYFCSSKDASIAASAVGDSLAMFHEDEGAAFVLDEANATARGFDLSRPMCRIVLEVFSALDEVGLTAGVATALADHGIPCNMMAAYYHDNVFVPEAMAGRVKSLL